MLSHWTPFSVAHTAAYSSDPATVCLPGVLPLAHIHSPAGPRQAMSQAALLSQGSSGCIAEPSV
eukprot:14549673-Heterocapsa_arctica.AAC.1